ncbi:hypothetical protein ACFE04_029456 [Oxalis oulophora]
METKIKMSSPSVRKIAECFVKPRFETEQEQIIHLSSWDIAMLSVHYIQKGLLFEKPQNKIHSIPTFIAKLKHSLSDTLVEFYPLAGRFATIRKENPHTYVVCVDCRNSPGAKLIQAEVDLSVADIMEKTYVPEIVHSFFDHDRKVNHDGHTESLLTIQVTELKDGIFIGVSMSHAIADGTSYWRFWEKLSRNFESDGKICNVNNLTVHNRWFPDGHDKIINLPYKHEDEFVSRFESPSLLERIFHVSSESIIKLKAKANAECNTTKISAFQSLAALVWKSITRSRNLPRDQIASCRMAINNRIRLNPQIPDNYFGNYIQTVKGAAIVSELLENNLGFAAMELHKAVINHCDEHVRAFLEGCQKTSFVYKLGQSFDPYCVMMGSSSRFNKYGSEFGLGRAIAIRSGYGNKFDGKVTSYPGRDGGGSVDLEVCLLPEHMKALESDLEFMSVVYVS